MKSELQKDADENRLGRARGGKNGHQIERPQNNFTFLFLVIVEMSFGRILGEPFYTVFLTRCHYLYFLLRQGSGS